MDDVQRMYILMKPLHSGDAHFDLGAQDSPRKDRLVIVAKKRLPDTTLHEKFFGFVWKSSGETKELVEALESEEYDTVTRGMLAILVGFFKC